MIPNTGGDVAAAVVAILGIAVLGITAVLSVSSTGSYRTRVKLASGTGVSLAMILFIWAATRSAQFIDL